MPIAAAGKVAGTFGLRAHLVALVSAVLLPALAVGGIAVGAAVGSYRTAFEAGLRDTARALASAVDTEIGAHVVALSTLATARDLDEGGGLAGFHERARRVADLFASRISVTTHHPDIRVVLHTAYPPGGSIPAAVSQRPDRPGSSARQVFDTGQPVVGDLVQGRATGRWVVPIQVPVIREGHVAYALGMALEGGRLRGLLQAQEFRNGSYASVIDGRGTIVARSTAHEEYVGRPVRDWLSSGARSGEAGLLRGVNHAGVETITAFRRLSGAPGWFVVVVEPLSSYHASLWPPIAALGLGSLGALALALVLALAIGGRILRPVGWLTRGAERIAASDGSDVTVPNDEPPSRVREFERLRAAVVQAHVTLRERASAVTAGEARLRAVVDTAVDAIVVIDQRGTMLSFNRAAEAIFGYTAAEAIGRNVSMLTGPEHSAKHDGYLAAYLRTGERKIIGIGQEVEGRRKDGTSVPLDLAIAEWRDAEGSRFFTGIMRDISARRADEARRALLMREVDHRAKNALAVVQSVLRLTRQEEPRAFVAAVEARVAALARAHSLLAQGGWSGADLRAVVERELAPYLPAHSSSAAQSATILLDGPPVALLPAAVQPLAMVLHELATNAAKHGALSVLGGAVEVRWWVLGQADEDGRLHLRWVETGGPAVSGIPSRRGFGTRLLEVTVRGQLGGSLSQHWGPTGLVCEITAPLQLVAAGSGMAGQSGAAAVASLSPA